MGFVSMDFVQTIAVNRLSGTFSILAFALKVGQALA